MAERINKILILVSRKPEISDLFLQKAVSEYYKIFFGAVKEPPVIARENGKPRVVNLPVFVSLSHSENITLAAVSEEPVGIDAERKKPRDFKKISARFFEKITDSPDEFYKMWTAKEAYKKATDVHLIDALKTPVDDNVTYLNMFEDFETALYCANASDQT